MNYISKIKDNLTPYAIAVFVPAFLSIVGFGIYHGEMHFSSKVPHCHADKVCHTHWLIMRTNIIVAAVSAVVAIVVWEGMHLITGVDNPKPKQPDKQFIWRKHV